MIRDFCAHVIHLAEYVMDANRLVHLKTLHDKAESVHKEAHGISRTFYP